MWRFKINLGRQLYCSRVGGRSFRFDNLVADQVLRVSLQGKNWRLVTKKKIIKGGKRGLYLFASVDNVFRKR